MAIRTARSCRVVFDGQSIVNVPPWDGNEILGHSWPRLLMAGRGIPGTDKPAIGGTSITSLSSTFGQRCAPYIAPPSLEPTIYVLCGGTTDIVSEGDSGAIVYANAWEMTDKARAVGAQYVICTTITPATGFTTDQNTRRLDANAAIMADASNKFDASVDIVSTGTDDPADTGAYFDGLHLYGFSPGMGITDPNKGTARVAAIMAPFLDAAIAAVTA